MICAALQVLDRDEQIVGLTRQLHDALKRAEPPLTAEQGIQVCNVSLLPISLACWFHAIRSCAY
jgi:hypothetical protein